MRFYRQLDGQLVCCDLPQAHTDDPSMFKFTLSLIAALAEREAQLISIRTKAALAAAKARGTELGTPDNLTPEAQQAAAEANRQAARQAYAKERNYVNLLRDQGLSYGKIADQLNEDGYTTRQGKPFQAMTVYRMVKRNGGD